eukprot:TRINITY_DN67817_c4_g1_i2.p1 TRINITY_DN67817_c4_g1~~TRINITY_DN67817_c4_g1_i2.p1  ORF type:complete len:229 (-),score=11.80 TRINITY_DN67817_c4_g1_i2:149-835(-)
MDMYGPSIPRLMNLVGHRAQADQANKKILPVRNYGLQAMSMGFCMEEGKSAIFRGPILSAGATQLIQETSWEELDILVIDMPPGTGDLPLTVAQRVSLDGAVVVSTPQQVAIADTVKGMDMLRTLNVPILGMVENMSHWICSKCGNEEKLFGEGGVDTTCKDFNVPLLGRIPFHPDVLMSSDDGTPVTITRDPDDPLAKPYFDLAQAVLDELSRKKQEENLGPRITMD